MAETYCGKTCADCGQKEQLKCPGCQAGPGRPFGGDCELASCIREKGHESCDTCNHRYSCTTLRSRDRIPEYRLRRLESEARRKAALAKRAPLLGKWLWLLFWLIIPSSVASIMTNDTVAGIAPGLYIPGLILDGVTMLAYGLILLKLAPEDEGYRTAGICILVAGSAVTLTSILAGPGVEAGWTLLITLPAAIISMAGEYREYMAHSGVLTGVDNELSEKWEKLWKWYIGSFCGMIGGIVLLLILPLLGALAVLAAAIAGVVVSILKLVYLYRTAKIFRDHCPAQPDPAV